MRIIFFFLLAMSQITVTAQPNLAPFSELSNEETGLFSSIKVNDGFIYATYGSSFNLFKINNLGKIVKKITLKENKQRSFGRVIRQQNRNLFFGINVPIFDGTNANQVINSEYRIVIEFDDDLNIIDKQLFQKLPVGYGLTGIQQTQYVIVQQSEQLRLSNDSLYSVQSYITFDSTGTPQSKGTQYEILDLKNRKTILTKDLGYNIGQHFNTIFTPNYFYVLGDVGDSRIDANTLLNPKSCGLFDLNGNFVKSLFFDNFTSGAYSRGSTGQAYMDNIYLAYNSFAPNSENCEFTTIDIRNSAFEVIKKIGIPDCDMVASGNEPLVFDKDGSFYFVTKGKGVLSSSVGLYKYDKNKELVWQKKYNLPKHMPISLQLTDDGDILLECLEVLNNGLYQLRLYRVNADGVIISTIDSEVFISPSLFYPNPFQSQLSLQENIEGTSAVTLYDISGRTVGVFSLNNNSLEVSCDLPKGTYIVQIKDIRGKILGQQVIIKQ